jgi:endonuclease V-like protein UPF0215 family
MPRSFSHVIGFDDGAFLQHHRGNVLVIGAIFSGLRLEGVVSGFVRRDGQNATRALARMVLESRYHAHLQAVLLQGIAFAGFNVVDLPGLHQALGIPVIAISRRQPDLPSIKKALLGSVPGGSRKWALIERAGPIEPVAGLCVQRAGIELSAVSALINRFAVNGRLPEPLRTAHLIAGGVAIGESRHRP